MEVFLLYILKSGICLAVFYVCFKALFGNDTFFRFNRRILLVGTGICMLLPLCRIKTSQPFPFSYTTSQWEMVFHEEEVNLLPAPDKEEVLTGMTGQKETSVPWVGIIGIVYFIGCCICLVTTVLSFRKMYQLSRSGRKLQQGKYTLILLPGSLSPFSWGRYIFLSEDDYRDHPDEILTHEKMHLRHNHSVDLAYMEMILLLQWLNPAVWLLKRELRDIHEYQADKGVLNQGIDATKYQLLLVKKAVGSSLYTLANSFNHSKIKKRITMMLKEKSNSWARLKLVLLVPVAACSMLAFARPDVNRELTNLMQSEDTTISPVGQPYTREFFDKEIDRYIGQAGGGQLSGSERLVFMEKHTRRVNFFINAKDQILYNSRFAGISEMPVKLKATLSASAGEKPVMIYFLCDVKTSDAAVKEALETVGKAFAEYQATAAGKNAPTLLFFGNPRKDYPLKGK